MSEHVLLLIDHKDGRARREPVHAEPLSDGTYRLLFSPGFVQGIARGDEFRVVNADGEFEVLRRGGNVAVQVYSSVPVDSLTDSLVREVATLGGVLDGSIDRGLVFTIPVAVGFPRIEAVFNRFVEDNPTSEWVYGNVYDPSDGKELNWWSDVASV